MPDIQVLVVEDDDRIRRLLIDCLRERPGVRVDAARDGAEALHRIRTRTYSVVLLDLMMPHMSGIDLLDSLRVLNSDAVGALPGPPRIIVITGAAADDVPDARIVERFPSAVDRVLRKPVDIPTLLEAVRSLS